MVPEYTVCIAIDHATSAQFMVSHRSWKKHHPAMFARPWLIMFDGWGDKALDRHNVEAIAKHAGVPHAHLVRWPPVKIGTHQPCAEYETQREKMVSAHVYAAEWCLTPYILKVDTDAVALESRQFPLDEWFNDYPAVVAPSWGYTKAKGGGGTVLDWCRKLEEWGDKITRQPRLLLENCINESGTKILMNRFCSWLAFYRVDIAKRCAGACASHCGDCRLPVPSEDTTRWYFLARRRELIRKVNQKRHGWTNVPKLSNLIEVTKQACNQ